MTYSPSLQMGAEPVWEIHFVSFEQGTYPDMSDAVAFRAAIDTDFLSGTTPMVRSLDIDSSEASSGVIKVPINTNTDNFIRKVDGRPSLPAYFELYGLDSEAKVIYDYRFGVNCNGTVDYQGGEPIPVVSGGVTLTDVYALLRAGYEVSFSEDGSSWHSTQTNDDRYYRTRYPEGEWSESILIGRGEDGTTPQLSIGTVTTLETGQAASAQITGPTSALLLDLGLPKGSTGPQGPSGVTPSFTQVTATTLLPDAQATASITADGANLSLSLGIPRGVTGQDGDDGTNGVGFTILGSYSAETVYNPVSDGNYDVVFYDGSSYAYIGAEATAGHTPPTSEMSDSYWQILAKRGDATGTITVDAANVIGLSSYIAAEVAEDYYDKTYIDSQLSTKLTTPNGGSNGQVLSKTSDGYAWTSNAPTATKLFSAANIGNAPFDGSASITLAQMGAAPIDHTQPISSVTGLEEALSAATSNAIEVVTTLPEASASTYNKAYLYLGDNHIYRGVATGALNTLSADFRSVIEEGHYLGDGIYTYDENSGLFNSREWYMDDWQDRHWVIQYTVSFPWIEGHQGPASGWVCSCDSYIGTEACFFAEAPTLTNPWDEGLEWRDYAMFISDPINGDGVLKNYSFALSAII